MSCDVLALASFSGHIDTSAQLLPSNTYRELQAEGVDTSFVLRAEGRPSPFTYIIVDSSGARTHFSKRPLQAELHHSQWLLFAFYDVSLLCCGGHVAACCFHHDGK